MNPTLATVRTLAALGACIALLPYACNHASLSPTLRELRTDTSLPARPDAPLSPAVTFASRQAVEVAPVAPSAPPDARALGGAGDGLRTALVRDLTTLLVRTALAEARWSEADHAAIWHTLRRWSERMGFTLDVAIRVRIDQFSRRPPKWIARLERSCAEPIGWPQRFSWAAHRDRCVELFARAESFLAGELPDVCPRAEGWRSRAAAARAFALGRVRVRCVTRTANVFLRSRG